MNKAITDGVLLMPPAFRNGLDMWSSGNGTPGSDTYEGATNAALVAADQDFGGCLELQKVNSEQKLRYKAETPLLPGCYLQIRARIKAIAGALPSVRIAGWAGGAGGTHINDKIEVGPTVTLATYGDVVEVAAIVGPGARGGVDMPWGSQAIYGHFGLDLTGANGGVVRIDDIEIEDVTRFFLRDMISIVDVRDYGAIGDGVTDDSAAFIAADAAAQGREILVPRGVYHLAEDVTLNAPVAFEGTVTMPSDKMLLLTKSYDLPTYIDAFDDEELAFGKAFQALLNNTDHDSLDMCGRKVTVTKPLDMQAVVPNKTSYATRRVIRNGQFDAASGSAWDTEVVTSEATYSTENASTLTDVVNIANVAVGALVEGNGVGREIYVRSKNVEAGELTLSASLYDAQGTQNYTFTEFNYMMDFSGFAGLSKFVLSDIEFQCGRYASGIRLSPTGKAFHLRDCFISRPKDRGVTSIGTGCQGILVDRCQFLSSEDSEDVPDRTSIALNVNGNDAKLRNNRSTRFKHFALLGGSNSVVLGNHFFQGDGTSAGVRTAGLVIADNYCNATITGNYVDNCTIEWTNERDPEPDFVSGFSFAAMCITDNIMLCGNVAPWFSFIVVKPHGSGHFLNGVTISGNRFHSINGNIDRVERVDTSFSDLDFTLTKKLTFDANAFHGIDKQAANPLRISHAAGSVAQAWNVGVDDDLPFGGRLLSVDSIVAQGPILNAAGGVLYVSPYVRSEQGADGDQATLVWPSAVRGEVSLIARMDR
ncbi:MAG: glycosyl hydrolase family 28-related protein [Sedimentitalea sp.]|uniref:glycosyl hydrolase family 28-related protein n=1 Tax=Sedimentitalea sp. TaxID=2048915 RepID=UPI003265EF97